MKENGTVTYTARGGQLNAAQAMMGDVLRGLIELLTNVDDKLDHPDRIDVTIRRALDSDQPTLVTVRDRAGGMSPDEMKAKLTQLGARTSGSATGGDSRGLFGFGAKDTAYFGKTEFESIKDGVYTNLIITRKFEWEMDSRLATADDYLKLHLREGESGLSATIHVSPGIAQVPEFSKLHERLSRNVQLRRINQDHKVTTSEFVDNVLSQVAPNLWELPAHDVLDDVEIDLPKYGCSATLSICRLKNREEEACSSYSAHGIEVHGKKAVYENATFGLSQPSFGHFHAVLKCPKIDGLILEFDAAEETETILPENPIRMVRRDRDGLVWSHPFLVDLRRAVVSVVKPLLDSWEPRHKETGSTALKNDLDRLSRLLADALRKDLDDEDGNFHHAIPSADTPIVVIPPRCRGRIGTTKTLTVLIDGDSGAKHGIDVSVAGKVATLVSRPGVPVPHEYLSNVLVTSFRVALSELGSTTIAVTSKSTPVLRTQVEVLVHDDVEDSVEPKTLQWKNEIMSVTCGRERSVTIEAPSGFAKRGVLKVNVVADDSAVSVLTSEVILRLNAEGWLSGSARIRGEKSGPSTVLRASDGTHNAVGHVRVVKPSGNSGLDFKIQIVDAEQGPNRGMLTDFDGERILKVWGRHHGVRRYLGQIFPDGSYEHDGEKDARAVLAETVATVITDFVLTKEVLRDPTQYTDVDKVIQKRLGINHKYLRIAVEVLNASE